MICIKKFERREREGERERERGERERERVGREREREAKINGGRVVSLLWKWKGDARCRQS